MKTIRCGAIIYAPAKILCVGKNFSDHVKEMGGAALPAEPVIFLKPNSALAAEPREVSIPAGLGLLHHEVELCCIAGAAGRDLTEAAAEKVIAGWAVGIDFTLRDRQAEAKKAGGPWALAKGFDAAAVIGAFVPASEVRDPLAAALSLSVNGSVRQQGSGREMIFTPGRILAFVSRFMTIEPGDILMCGTPAGVGEVRDGDAIVAEATGLPRLAFTVRRS